jgi:hypothetical protein
VLTRAACLVWISECNEKAFWTVTGSGLVSSATRTGKHCIG